MYFVTPSSDRYLASFYQRGMQGIKVHVCFPNLRVILGAISLSERSNCLRRDRRWEQSRSLEFSRIAAQRAQLNPKTYCLWIFGYIKRESIAQEPLSAIAPSKDSSSWRLAFVFCVPLVLSPGDGRAPSLNTFLIRGTSEISDNVSSSNETGFPWTEASRCVAMES